MHIGKRLKIVREERKMTLLEVAKALGVTEATVQRYESGNIKNLKLDTITKLASILKVDPAYLMGWRDTKEDLRLVSDYPYYPVSISAGLPIDVGGIDGQDVETITIPDTVMGRWAGAKDVFITKVNGESMNRVIPHGSLIAVKQVELSALNDGDIVVYSDNHSYSVKRFYNDKDNKRLIFRPDSTDKSFVDHIVPYSAAKDIKIHGRVVIYVVELD